MLLLNSVIVEGISFELYSLYLYQLTEKKRLVYVYLLLLSPGHQERIKLQDLEFSV